MASASKNIFWLSLSRVISLGLLFLAYTQLFRYLGPHASGQQQFILSYSTLFGVIVDFGLAQYIIKKMSEEPEQKKRYFQNFLASELVLATLVYASMLVVAKLAGYEPLVFQGIAVAGIGIFLAALMFPFLAVLNVEQDLRKVAFLNFLQSAINIAFIAITIFFHRGIVFLVSNQVAYGLIALVFYYFFVRKYFAPQVTKAMRSLDFKLVRHMLSAALPFALLVSFSTIYNRIDVVLITNLLNYTQTGLYTAAYKFFDIMGFFPAVVSYTLYPLFAGFSARGEKDMLKTMFEKYLRLLIALALPMAIGGSLLAAPLIRLLAGREFAASGPVLAILVWAPAALFIYTVANSLVISQLTKYAVMITGINVVINIVGNLLLLPHVGIRGAAIMTVVSETLQGIFYFYFVWRKITHFSFFVLLWRPALASLVMGLVLFPLRNENLGLTLPLGALVYALSLLVLRFFRADDISFIKSFFRRTNANAPFG